MKRRVCTTNDRGQMTLLVGLFLFFFSLLSSALGETQPFKTDHRKRPFLPPILLDAKQMINEGRKTFRFDTFGDEAFWGDTLRLHEAIAGQDNGGIGGGVSPNTALAVGLKVDKRALTKRHLRKRLKGGKSTWMIPQPR